MKLDVKIRIALSGVFGFIVIGGGLVAAGEILTKPEIGKAGWAIIVIGILVIIGFFALKFKKSK